MKKKIYIDPQASIVCLNVHGDIMDILMGNSRRVSVHDNDGKIDLPGRGEVHAKEDPTANQVEEAEETEEVSDTLYTPFKIEW